MGTKLRFVSKILLVGSSHSSMSAWLLIIESHKYVTNYAQCNGFTKMHRRPLIKCFSSQKDKEPQADTRKSMCFPNIYLIRNSDIQCNQCNTHLEKQVRNWWQVWVSEAVIQRSSEKTVILKKSKIKWLPTRFHHKCFSKLFWTPGLAILMNPCK